ncbi:MAG TPA: Uma2 family endonuclease [Spirillospora sp.]
MTESDELYRRHERREIYHTGGCPGVPEPYWCWSCERYADPEPRPARSLTKEGYLLSLVDEMRAWAPEAVPKPPPPYGDPPPGLVEESEQWRSLRDQKIADLAAILGDPVGGGPSRHLFALPPWPGFWLERTTLESEAAEYVIGRKFVRRSGTPMRSPYDMRPWSVVLSEAWGFFGLGVNRTPNAIRQVVRFELDGRPMEAVFVFAKPDGIALVLEVTSSRPERDRVAERHGYARAGIPLYLLVDREESKVTLFSDPDGGD